MKSKFSILLGGCACGLVLAVPQAAWAVGQTAPDAGAQTARPPSADQQTAPDAGEQAARPAPAGSTGQAADRTDGSQLADIIVTAEKKNVGQSLQRTPISVTAVTPATIAALNIKDVTDIGRLVPNAQLDGVGTYPGFANFTIRGIGVTTSLRSVDPAVNIFQDGMVVGYQAGAVLDAFDVESIQVLRGPQGVLFGRNSTGGAVLFTTPMPTREFHASADLTYGNFNEISGHAVVQGSLSGDAILGKVAISIKTNDGYFRNVNGTYVPAPGNPTGAPRTHAVGNSPRTREYIIKPTFLFNLADGLKFKLLTQYLRYRDGGGPSRSFIPDGLTTTRVQTYLGYTPPPGYTIDMPDVGFTNVDAYHAIGELDANVGSGAITTTLAYRGVTYNSTLHIEGTPFLLANNSENNEHNDQGTFESRYNGNLTDKLEITAGIFGFANRTNVTQYVVNSRALSLGDVNSFTYAWYQWTQTDTLGAIYGNLDYHPVEGVTISAGGRYEREHKRMHIIPNSPCTGIGVGCTGTYVDSTLNSSSFTPRALISYQAAPDVLFYASYTKGYTAGNYNSRPTTAIVAATPTQPEFVTAYEAGAKTQLLNRHLKFNLAVYQNNFRDIQRTVNTVLNGAPFQTLTNAAQARIRGVELETSVIPFQGLQLNANVGYTNGRFLSFSGLAAGVDGTTLELDHVPKWNYNISGTYTVPVADAGKLSFNVDYSWRSRVFTDITNNPLLAQPAYGLLNGSIEFHSSGAWYLRGFIRNVSNTDYFFIASPSLGYQKFGGQPRTYGAQVGVNF